MTQMYDPHEEWIGEDKETPADKVAWALKLLYGPVDRMVDRAYERDRRDTGTPDE